MKRPKKSTFRALTLALVAVVLLPFAATAPAQPLDQVPEPDPLTDREVQQLAAAAYAVRVGLAELRTLAAQPENQARREELFQSIEGSLKTFLDVARLSRADFVRLIDGENGIDTPSRETDERVVLRPLAPRER